MIGALLSSAILWILMVTIAKDELFSYRQAFFAVIIGGITRIVVQIGLSKVGMPHLIASAGGLVVGLGPLYLYLNHLGYNKSLIARVVVYFVIVSIVTSGIIYLMSMPVDVTPSIPE